ncbi:hypothetical protein D3C80_1653840 [compost metagenome]
MAALLLTEWEIGQRLADAYLFRASEHYGPEQRIFQFAQSKTDEKVSIPVGDRLAAMLEFILEGGRLSTCSGMRGPLVRGDEPSMGALRRTISRRRNCSPRSVVGRSRQAVGY